MNEEIDSIAALDDATARRVLATVARARLHGGVTPLEPTPDLGRALAEALEVAPPHEPAAEGDVARLALRLLAEDPVLRTTVRALAAGPAPERFDPAATLAVTAAVLLVLQTHVRFARGKDGRWTLTVEKKPTTEALLKPLVQKLLSLFPGK
ncbi:MAG TPA: hypothetical protein VF590_06330 [Isosphaeraceae bacterium]|jgi:hypothetical protein